MIIDALAKLSAEQDVTASAASTNYIDTVAAGDAYVAPFAFFKVDTDVTSGTTVNFVIQTSDTSTFASTTTLYDSGALAVADLVVGKFVAGRIAQNAQRYIRAYYTVVDGPLTAGAFTAALVKEVPTEIS
jgi:hypothetical protein